MIFTKNEKNCESKKEDLKKMSSHPLHTIIEERAKQEREAEKARKLEEEKARRNHEKSQSCKTWCWK